MQSGWCVLCGHEGQEEFAWKRANAELVRVTRRSDALLRFVMCPGCGHVYQHPMLDAEELSRLYTQSAAADWDERPPDPEAMRIWGDWVLHTVPIASRGAILADCGGGAGAHVEPFQEAGWRIQTLRLPVNGRLPDLSEPASLVLLPHTLERLPDPVPVLKALRRHMPPDGVLALATVDILAPRTAARDAQAWLSDGHVRLYSFNSVQGVLARAGFRAESVRRMTAGAVAVIACCDEQMPQPAQDDPMALQQLYHAIRRPGSADTLGHNLAALAETQPAVLPLLCRRMERDPYTVRRSGHCLVAVVAQTGEAGGLEELPIVQWGDVDGFLEPPHHEGATQQTLIQLGLGSGELATALAERLQAGQHLFIWEADAALAKAVLAVVDLSPLWLSTQVSLLIGVRPYWTAEQRRRLREPTLVYSTRSARQWNTWLYRDIISSVAPIDGPEDDSEAVDMIEGPRALQG